MQRGLFFTTMRNHRPVYVPTEVLPAEGESNKPNNTQQQQQPPLENKRQIPRLRDNISRSTQPLFSVSAMFGVRSGGGCGSCGH